MELIQSANIGTVVFGRESRLFEKGCSWFVGGQASAGERAIGVHGEVAIG